MSGMKGLRMAGASRDRENRPYFQDVIDRFLKPMIKLKHSA